MRYDFDAVLGKKIAILIQKAEICHIYDTFVKVSLNLKATHLLT